MTAPRINPELDVLEATLRDGSYVVDFQFTAEDTAWLVRQLDEVGINWIEIGHGLGLGASNKYRRAAATDAEYIDAARGALTHSKIGMFCIPGVATFDDLRMAADHGMHFVRVGANGDRTRDMEPYIRLARSLGMRVCTNFMKSYTLPPDEFAAMARLTEEWGSQMNYVVDSAGGMLPDEVRAYCEALAEKTSVPYGFHGHDNIRLAIANSLVAIDCGALWVDTTLFGVGRGSGNASTELMTGILQERYGVLPHINVNMLIQLADSQALPLTHNRHQETLSMSLGLAQVHSMYLDKIVDRAKVAEIDPHDLIAEVGRIDRLNTEDAAVEQAVSVVKSRASRTRIPVGGIFQLDHDGTVEGAMRVAENVAEKLALPCIVWVKEMRDGETVVVTNSGGAIEVRYSGDPKRAANAAQQPITTIILAQNLAEFAPSLQRPSGPRIAVADVAPKWAAN